MRRTCNPTFIHVMADGRTLTHEEFFAKPFEVKAENNVELIKESNIVLDPNYLQKEALRRQYQRTEQRRKELEKHQAQVDANLQKLK